MNGTVAYNGPRGLDTASVGPGHSAKPRSTARSANLVVGARMRFESRNRSGPWSTVPGTGDAWRSPPRRTPARATSAAGAAPGAAARARPPCASKQPDQALQRRRSDAGSRAPARRRRADGDVVAVDAHRPRDPRWRVLLDARAVRLRQDDDPAPDRRVRAADRGSRLAARRGRHSQAAIRARREHRLPGLRAVPAHDGRRQRRLRAHDPEGRRRPTASAASARRWRWSA